MTVSRRDDLTYAILMITAVFFYSSMGADPLYTDYGYLLAVPVVTLLPGLILRAPALFLTGTTFTAIATLLIYMKIMSSLDHIEGMLALGHMFSVPAC